MTAAGVAVGVIGLQGNLGAGTGFSERRNGWRVWTPAACGCEQILKAGIISVEVVAVGRLGKFRRGDSLNSVSLGAGREAQQRERRRARDACAAACQRHAEQSRGITRNSCYQPSSGLHGQQLNLGKEWGFSAKVARQSGVQCTVGVASLEEPKPDAEDQTQEQEHSGASVVPGEDFSEKLGHVSTVPEEVLSQVGGKAGSISFYTRRSDSFSGERAVESVAPSPSKRRLQSLIWPLGPFVLVASVVLPPLYLRRVFGALLEDSLITDFVILFFTETLFFAGASVFLYIAHISRLAAPAVAGALEQKPAPPVFSLGYRLGAKITLGIGVLLPVATFVLVWPWTGPAAAAALAPYMIGLLVQLGFEHVIRKNDSPVWPLVPVTFQMYRLHQLNRAAQLVAGLLFSLKGVEATAETMAINGSLQTLLFVLQVLGMLCLWSLGSFLTNHLPSERGQTCIPSIP